MSWNYRVVKGTDEFGDEYFGIHEVYYNDDNSIRCMSENLEPVTGETLESLKSVLEKMKKCLDKPLLIEDKIIFVDPDTWESLGKGFIEVEPDHGEGL